MEHTRAALRRLVPRVGDAIYSTRRRPLVTLVQDTSPGVHDTLIAACDPERYRLLGGAPDHRSCAQNFAEAIAEHGRSLPRAPAPLNLFMAIPWSEDGELEFAPSPAQAGDSVTFRGGDRRAGGRLGVPDGPQPHQRDDGRHRQLRTIRAPG